MNAVRPIEDRFREKVSKGAPEECWPWTGATNEHGYGLIRTAGKRGRLLKAHRLALQLTGVDIDGTVVRHICDNPPCCNPAHLITGSQADNIRDMHDRGRGNIGVVNGAAKLTPEAVRGIRLLLVAGVQGKEIAACYGVGQMTVSAIKSGRTWRHVA